jgi:hypothetical protein
MDPKPWERQADESEAAYAAFRTFLELGADRSIRAAYRQATGNSEAAQAPGSWNKWVEAHSWSERARAWDNRGAAVRQETIERAIAADAEEWARRRNELHEREWKIAQRLLRKADRLSQFPVQRRTKGKDGEPTTIEPIDPAALRVTAQIAREGSALARAAIDAALERDQEQSKGSQVPSPDSLARASKELGEFVEEHRRKIATIPAEPPGEDEDSPIDANDTRGS